MVLKRLTAAALLLFLLSHPAIGGGEAPTSAIGVEELRDHVRTLAADDMAGRRAGTAGAEQAAAYIASEFERAGLVPGGDEGGWLQWFGLPGGDPVPEECHLTLTKTRGEPESFPVNASWSPFTFSQGRRIEGAQLAFVGYGIRAPKLGYDDYAGRDVRGKIVVVLRHGPRERAADYAFRGSNRSHLTFLGKAQVAEKAGAAGMILVNDLTHHPGQPDRCITKLPSVGGGVQIPAIFARREVVEAAFAAAGADLKALEKRIDETGRPESRDLEGVRIDLAVKLSSRRSANVIGILPGTDPKLAGEVIVVGAHYDHIGTDGQGALDPAAGGAIRNGADDNASGTAGVIELAEHFAHEDVRPGRTMVFVAFTGEELGLLGSRHYVEHPRFPLADTVAMVNMDMIGRGADGKLFIGGTGTSPVFPPLIERATEGAGFDTRQSPGGYAPSDNTSFYAKGIPSLFFHTGLHDDYHQATDDWDKLDYDVEQRILEIVRVIVDGLARVPEVPLAPKLGIRMAPGAGGPGPLVGGIEPDSPAARAGMKRGDRILRFGEQSVPNTLALQKAIGLCRFGDEVVVVVLRGNAEVSLTVRFAR